MKNIVENIAKKLVRLTSVGSCDFCCGRTGSNFKVRKVCHTHTHLSTRWTFWTHFVTINLFSLYLMNFVFHNTLDAASELVPRVHYKSMKCDASFSQGIVSTIFRWGGHFHTHVKNFFPVYRSAKIININCNFSKLRSEMYCHLFMVHSVHYLIFCWIFFVMKCKNFTEQTNGMIQAFFRWPSLLTVSVTVTTNGLWLFHLHCYSMAPWCSLMPCTHHWRALSCVQL